MSRVIINRGKSKGTINPNIYGHFSEHIGGVMYDGIWVGEDSDIENYGGLRKALVDSFKKINPPVVRWPGGCFAETYDWRDGIGPRDKRPERVNWWYNWDGRTESNQMGTHEFMRFCRLVGAQPYVAANITSMTPQHIRDWMEYCNMPAGSTTLARERGENGDVEPFGVQYWGIGNENWGDGGHMTPEMYTREYIRYATICWSAAKNARFIVGGANGGETAWTRGIMEEAKKRGWDRAKPYGMSVHYYTSVPGEMNRCFIEREDEWNAKILRAANLAKVLDDHRAVMDEYDPKREIPFIVDEWGCWHSEGSGPSKGYNLFEEQITMRDAVVSALSLNIFNNRCDFVAMANAAQLVNNLHTLYLTSGKQFVETANYHVFDLYKGHQGGRQVQALADCGTICQEGFGETDAISVSASEKDGILTVTMANLSMTRDEDVELCGMEGKGTIRVMSHKDKNACNTFDAPDTLKPTQRELEVREGTHIELPAGAVAALTVRI